MKRWWPAGGAAMKRLFLIGVTLSMIAVGLIAMDDNVSVAKKGEAANHIPDQARVHMADKAKENAGICDFGAISVCPLPPKEKETTPELGEPGMEK